MHVGLSQLSYFESTKNTSQSPEHVRGVYPSQVCNPQLPPSHSPIVAHINIYSKASFSKLAVVQLLFKALLAILLGSLRLALAYAMYIAQLNDEICNQRVYLPILPALQSWFISRF